jgi:hypothetical protein
MKNCTLTTVLVTAVTATAIGLGTNAASAACLCGSISFNPYTKEQRPENVVTRPFSGTFTYQPEESLITGWYQVKSFFVETPLSRNTYTLPQLVSSNLLLFNPSSHQLAGFNFGTSLDSAVFSPLGARPDLEFFAPSFGNRYRASTIFPDTSGGNLQFGEYKAEAVPCPEPSAILGTLAFGATVVLKRKWHLSKLTYKKAGKTSWKLYKREVNLL